MADDKNKKTPGEVLARAVETGKTEGVYPSDISVTLDANGGTVRVSEPRPADWQPRDATA